MKPPSVTPVTLWDPVVRLTHWSVAIVVLINAVLTEGGSSLHIWAGWIGLGLLALRFLWGFLAPGEARFVAFPPAPRAAFAHLANLLAGQAREHPSHNPAGALMAYALWATLIVLSVTGLLMTGGKTPMQMDAVRATVATGDWSVLVKEDGASPENGGPGKVAEEMHEIAGNLILILVLLHVGGVVVESRALRRNLVHPMIFGDRK
jgi:cytochrome b